MNIIFIIISIIFVSFLPIPTTPIFLYTYSKYNIFGFPILYLAGLCSIFTQYVIGYFLKLSNLKRIVIKRFNYAKIYKYIENISNLSLIDLVLLRFTIPGTEALLNVCFGYLKVSILKVIFFNFITLVPFQIIYFYSSKNIDILNKIFKILGLDITSTTFISILTLTLFLALFFRMVKIIFKIRKKNF